MDRKDIWGTPEYCENVGFKRGFKKCEERDIQNLAKHLICQNGGKLTREEALEEARLMMLGTKDELK